MIGRDLLFVLVFGSVVGAGGAWWKDNPHTFNMIRPAKLDNGNQASNQIIKNAPRVASRDFPLCSSAIRRNCVVDGDTFYLDHDKVRIADIDAPETHPSRCSDEERLGRQATRRLSSLLSSGTFELASIDRDEDNYGRKLRVVVRAGRSIGDILVSEGLARTWTGRREPWCSGSPT